MLCWQFSIRNEPLNPSENCWACRGSEKNVRFTILVILKLPPSRTIAPPNKDIGKSEIQNKSSTHLGLRGCCPGWRWSRQKAGGALQKQDCGWEAGRRTPWCRCRPRRSWTCPLGRTPAQFIIGISSLSFEGVGIMLCYLWDIRSCGLSDIFPINASEVGVGFEIHDAVLSQSDLVTINYDLPVRTMMMFLTKW